MGRGWVPGTACAVLAVAAAVASGVAAALLWQHALGGAATAAQAWVAGEHPAWLGALLSALLCYGNKRGYYHLVALPLIPLEMEDGRLSWIGAMDACALCAVSAGICAAAALRRRRDRRAREGLRVNILIRASSRSVIPVGLIGRLRRCRALGRAARAGARPCHRVRALAARRGAQLGPVARRTRARGRLCAAFYHRTHAHSVTAGHALSDAAMAKRMRACSS